MTPELWARIREIFGTALELPRPERDAFVDGAAQGDESIRTQVKALLAAADQELTSPLAGSIAAALPLLREGNLVGRYRIERHIGGGGMGEVYRALDPELARVVALKLLRANLAGDTAMQNRFMREARAASSISHPNVVRIYDVGEAGGQAFIAMEFLEGRPLDQVISAGGMPVPQALDFASSIAAGLADAHAHGIVHRDLKPSNVIITSAGEVKLLDFGLAKRVELGGGSDSTLTMRGEILGTPAYMSPEQAQGKEVDSRSDIFSFGSVLYEMLSGRRAFTGDSAVSLLGAIVREDPPPLKWIPPELQNVLSRCLRKDPARRVQHMGDVRLMIEEARDALLAPRRRLPLRAIAAALGFFAIGAAIPLLLLTGPGDSRAVPRFTPFAVDTEATSNPAWSPDGKSIAYLGNVDGVDQVFVRNLGAASAAVITRSPRGCGPPFWSVDGTRVFYNQGGDLWSASLAGGEPRLELRDVRNASRSPDGKTLAFLRGTMGHQGLWLQSEADPEPRQYRREPFPAAFVAGYEPTFSPDGSRIGIVVDRETGGGTGEFWVLPVGQGVPRRVPASLPASAWLRFSWWTDPRTVLMARSDPGHLHLELMDLETGAIRPLTTGTGQESEPALSPDGRTIAFTAGRTDMDLVELTLDGSVLRPLLATALDEQCGAWLPSGAEYAYITNRSGTPEVWLRRSTEFWTKPILSSNADGVPSWYLLYALRASPDGQHVSYDVLGNRHWIWISALSGGRPAPLDTESTDQHAASWSPDGKRLAYRRLQGGRFQLSTIAFGGGAPVSIAETGEGGHMRGGLTDWSPTGEWICHNSPSGLELVSPDGKRRRLLSRTPYLVFVFSGDGAAVIALRRSERRSWQLIKLPVAGGAPQEVVDLPVPPGTTIFDMTRHPDGKRLLLTIATPRQSVWLVEGFAQPRPWWRRFSRE